jgi:pantothenate kinase-related protein Tda10
MSLSLSALVSPLLMALYDFKEPMQYASLFVFDPPNCEHQVVFPKYPQKIGLLKTNDSTYSAQLSLKDSFLRADCQEKSLPHNIDRKSYLESLVLDQINNLGGNKITVLKYDINDESATYTGQVIIQNVSIMVTGGFYIGNNSLMSLTAIDKYSIQSSSATTEFIGSASQLTLPEIP